MSGERRPEGTGRETQPRGSSWLGRALWLFVGVLVLIPSLMRFQRGAGVAGEGPHDDDTEETGMLASPWFWRALWVLIGGLMLLLFLYEFLVLS